VRRSGVLAIVLLALAAGTGCGGSPEPKASAAAPAPACPAAWKATWQRLANRIKAPVYCPSWMPDPLTGQIGGRWNNIDSVDRHDRSYLIGFVWQEKGIEIHVNLRGYPGRTRIPTCLDTRTVAGKTRRVPVPCFADPGGRKRAAGIDATVYTVNRDADQWHILYAWRRHGSLYTISQHVAPPLGYAGAVRSLDRMLRTLVLVEPTAGT
jgi:hypothetical protein